VSAGDLPSPQTKFEYTRFDLALAYRLLPELVLDVGYDTFTSTLNQAGTKANPFYQIGDTVFYADVAFLPEQLLQRIARSASAPAPTAAR
jgi:hypothetical protein